MLGLKGLYLENLLPYSPLSFQMLYMYVFDPKSPFSLKIESGSHESAIFPKYVPSSAITLLPYRTPALKASRPSPKEDHCDALQPMKLIEIRKMMEKRIFFMLPVKFSFNWSISFGVRKFLGALSLFPDHLHSSSPFAWQPQIWDGLLLLALRALSVYFSIQK